MSTIEEQIIETWFINHRANLLLMNALTEEALGFTTSQKRLLCSKTVTQFQRSSLEKS